MTHFSDPINLIGQKVMNVMLKLRQVTYNGICAVCKIEECNLYAAI